MQTKVNVDRLENIIKMFAVIKQELAYAMPPEMLGAHFRELDGCCASIRNVIRSETGGDAQPIPVPPPELVAAIGAPGSAVPPTDEK